MSMANAAPRLSRRLGEGVFLVSCWVATGIALIALTAILFSLLTKGVGGLDLNVFTKSTPAPGSVGGLLNAILGSLMMCVLAMIGASLVGFLAGTWLSEFARDSHYGKVVRFLNDVLLSARRSWSACSSTNCWCGRWAGSPAWRAPSPWA